MSTEPKPAQPNHTEDPSEELSDQAIEGVIGAHGTESLDDPEPFYPTLYPEPTHPRKLPFPRTGPFNPSP